MPKHRRARNANDLKRGKAKKRAYDRVLIVCEGSKTEPNYLDEIRQAARIPSVDLRVIASVLGTEPRQVVQSAEAEFGRTKAYEQVYAVFDRDDHQTYANAIAMAEARDKRFKNDEGKAVRFEAVTSVPSFEFWLLIHFENIQGFLHRDVVLARVKNHIASYEKGNKDTYAKTVHVLEVAIERAAALRNLYQRLPGEDPYTDMDELVKTLRALRQAA